MIKWIIQEYGSIFKDGSGKMFVSRGKFHKYLSMNLDYTICGQAQITMIDSVEEILIAFDKVETKGGGTKRSAAPDNLFKLEKYCEKLPHNKTVQFHNLVAKTLYATKRARPDTCTAIEFLTTIVQAPNLDDWGKMVHMMRYIRGTRTLPLILISSVRCILQWWVDA